MGSAKSIIHINITELAERRPERSCFFLSRLDLAALRAL